MKSHWSSQLKSYLLNFRSRFTRGAAKRYLYLSVFTGLFAASLPLLDYIHQDVTISTPGEVFLLCIFFVATSLAILASYCFWLKSNAERLLATIVFVYVYMEYYGAVVNWFSWLSTRIGSTKSAVLIQIVGYILVGAMAKLIYLGSKKLEPKGLPKDTLETVAKFACIVVAILNLYSFLAYSLNRQSVNSYKQPQDVEGVSSLGKSQEPKRDIYYFVFDRYANAGSLKDNFNFDNSEYISWLKSSGFYVRDNATSNYQFTAPSVASTMRMDFHADLAKKFPGSNPNNVIPYKNLIQNSQALTLLHKAGYDVYNVGNWWNITRVQKEANNILPLFKATIFSQSFNLTELQSKGLDKSFLGGFLKHGVSIAGFDIIKITNGAPRDIYLRQLQDLKAISAQPHSKPRVIFAHLLNTHPPYVFNADGSMPAYDISDTDTGIARSTKYINQLKYANSSTKDLITTIKQSSKVEPVIIIQADEGPYPLGFPKKWQEAPTDILKMKFGILAAYSLPGVNNEDASKIGSSVNIFRFVFNKYFNTNFKYLPDCSFVYNPEFSKPFVYYNVTSRLHPADTACEKYK
jgi:hypothetical protein